MRKYILEMRIKHWIKNLIIFFPIVFSENLLEIKMLLSTLLAFLSFCLLSSSVYIINDISDIEQDKLHYTKRNRPIASGLISLKQAYFIILLCFIGNILILSILYFSSDNEKMIFIVPFVYFIINIIYSLKGMKKIPILDVLLLASGFFLRLLLGSIVTNIKVSSWLYMVVLTGSFYMGFGKRRNEMLKANNPTRDVLHKYNINFLDKCMYSCMTLTIVFFSLWCMEKENEINRNYLILIPLLMTILFKYSLDIESDKSDGDPINVIFKEKSLIVLATIMCISIMILVYG